MYGFIDADLHLGYILKSDRAFEVMLTSFDSVSQKEKKKILLTV